MNHLIYGGVEERSIDTLPPREVPATPYNIDEPTIDIAHIETAELDKSAIESGDNPTAAVEIDVSILEDKVDVFTRFTDPWKKERVDEILKQVKIGPDLEEGERKRVREFIAEWADIFALSVGEVKQVDDAVHHLDIPAGASFSTKIGQKPLRLYP